MYIETKHLHRYQTNAEFEAIYNGSGYTEPWVSYIDENERVDYNKSKLSVPFTIKMLDSGEFTMRNGTGSYSINGGAWTAYNQNFNVPVSVNSGDEIAFKSTAVGGICGLGKIYFHYVETPPTFNVFGNIMSVAYGDNFEGVKTLDVDMSSLLAEQDGLISAKDLLLPATTLSGIASYSNMFQECRFLTSAPELPATVITDYCYESMFSGCTALTSGPSILPATELKFGCYHEMFVGCESLTRAPELPATVLTGEGCYESMFEACYELSYIKALFLNEPCDETTYENSYLTNWVRGVARNGTFVMNANAQWDPDNEDNRGFYGIPSNWTVQDA